MCGLAGFWQRDGGPEDGLCQDVLRMTGTLAHRGPDDQGAWADPQAGVALGFRRLAILDLSPTGRQPMRSDDGRWIIVFNGEIYNFRELRATLEQTGVRFRGTSDTEVILAGCSAWGVEGAIPRLWGMFAMAVWDAQTRRLILARDRVGKKPLYYSLQGSTFLFGSELKALHAHPAFAAGLNRDALARYVRHGYVPAPESIFQGVFKLPPGHYAEVESPESLRLHCYWEARRAVRAGAADRLDLSEPEAVEALDRILRDAVGRRMIADVPLGALLSGGVDSSTVAALMQAQSARPVKTFSIGFREPRYDEAGWARAVAKHLGTDHTELYASPDDALAIIPRLPDLYDEPFADSSQIPTFLVCGLVRQHVTVALSGDGGDELFGGYARYDQAAAMWARLKPIPPAVRRGAAALLRAWPADRWSGWLAARDETALYRQHVSLWREPQALVPGRAGALPIFEDPTLAADVPEFVERMMYIDLVTYLPDDILVKLDRASMGVSLEARCPLLDHRLVEWVWRLPLKFRRRAGRSKWLLWQVLYRYVPPALVERPKMGFGAPIDEWLRGPLRDWAEALLDERRLRQDGYFRPGPIRAAWARHLDERRDEQYPLWVVLMFQAWCDRWLKA